MFRSMKDIDMDEIVLKAQKLPEQTNPLHKRTSKFTGVIKNGKDAWYSVMNIDTYRCYLGTHNEESLAAKIYDIAQIQNKGLETVVNFSYTKAQILAILQEKSIV